MSVDLLIASGSLTTSVSRLDDDHDYSRTLVYTNEVVGKPGILANVRLTPRGEQAAATHDPAISGSYVVTRPSSS